MPTPAPVDDSAIAKALAHHEAHAAEYLEELKTLVRIPSVSFEGFDKAQVRKSGEATCALMRKKGFDNVQLLEMPNAHPYVYGEWTAGAGPADAAALRAPRRAARRRRRRSGRRRPVRAGGAGRPPLRARRRRRQGRHRGAHRRRRRLAQARGRAAAQREDRSSRARRRSGSATSPEFLRKHKKLLQADAIVLTDTAQLRHRPAVDHHRAARARRRSTSRCRALKQSVHSRHVGRPGARSDAWRCAKMLAPARQRRRLDRNPRHLRAGHGR